MYKRIAIPLENGLLCAHFGHCQQFSIIDVAGDAITRQFEVTPPLHQPGLYPQWIASQGVTDVIAGGMGQQAISLFNDEKINVFVGAPILGVQELVKGLVSGQLSLSANYCNH